MWRRSKYCQLAKKMFNRACDRDRLFKSQRRGIEKTKCYRNQATLAVHCCEEISGNQTYENFNEYNLKPNNLNGGEENLPIFN